MAVTVQLDVIAEIPRVRDETGRITELLRYCDVYGLTTGSNMLRSSLRQSGVPEPGDQHPDEATLYIEDRIPQYLTQTAARIELVYRFREQVEEEGLIVRVSERMIRGGSQVAWEQTQFDREGNQIFVRNASDTEDDPVEFITSLHASSRLTVQWEEPHPFPPNLEEQWTNKLNSSEWLGRPARTWICQTVDYQLRDDSAQPKLWSWTFEFIHKPEVYSSLFGNYLSPWDHVVVAKDPRTGRPMRNPDPGINQIRVIEKYSEIDYNTRFTK